MKIVLKRTSPDRLYNDLRELDLDELILMPTDDWLKIEWMNLIIGKVLKSMV